MRRRDLLTGFGFGGYSLIVLTDQIPPAPQTQITDRIRREFDRIAPHEASRPAGTGEPNMALVDLDTDVFIAGGGLAGVCAAVSAARNGARVILVQDRSRLGGNSSSEVKMHVVGANCHRGRPGWREGGLIEEFRLDDAANNPQRCWELWDLLLYDKVISEPNITLLLETAVYSAAMKDGRIDHVMARLGRLVARNAQGTHLIAGTLGYVGDIDRRQLMIGRPECGGHCGGLGDLGRGTNRIQTNGVGNPPL
jgi:glycine/D-amino acid oxidase-like deaminating enzyme